MTLDESDKNNGLYFYKFDDRISLREVIIGPLCLTDQRTLVDATKHYDSSVELVKARMAFHTFDIVRDRQWFVVEELNTR